MIDNAMLAGSERSASLRVAPPVQAAAAFMMDSLLREHAPLVRRSAQQLLARLPASVQQGDLEQAGMIGLMDAIARYEDHPGVPFGVYASQRIRGAMLDDLRANDWFPRGVRRNQRRIDATLGRLEQSLGRPAGEAEVAEALGVTLLDYRAMLAEAKGFQLVFLEDLGGDEDGSAYLDRHLADGGADPFRCLTDGRFREDLAKAITQLPEREQLVMAMYYERDLNLEEVGAVLGVSASRVCQLHGEAVLRLRGKLRSWLS